MPEERRSIHELPAVVTPCDIVAGDPDDPRRITDGVPWGLVNMRQGLQECSAALTSDGKRPRQKEEAEQRLEALGLENEALSKARTRALDWLRLNGG
ncbi:hypothetical protein [Parasedimentitalea psychrophila]|uniref:Uncharacterized protein n=1 Tax=Parasedimentitalea psychrophila TaxID=2997337 RepID=A0A9Y2P209_9RHOB|nr:hypothetical protein [Parasedimentitalea psychrophila]WIY26146.1 hypothetical protein QPJ95_04270 [Parasedimentitalea psychrophila]